MILIFMLDMIEIPNIFKKAWEGIAMVHVPIQKVTIHRMWVTIGGI